MNKKRWFLFALGILVLFSIGVYRNVYRKAYFIPVKIEGNTPSHIPYVKVEVEGKEYFFVLDLGFDCQAGIDPPCLLEIQNKVFEKTATFMGFLGNKYQKKVYKIPELNINRMKFHSVFLHERNSAFYTDATINSLGGFLPEITSGTLGSRLFKETCLCLDLHSSMMGFCDSFDTFKRELKPHNPLSKVSFSFQNGFIEFDINTSQGALHCMLDTGCTLNFINTPNPDHVLINEFIKTKHHFDNVQIGEMDFGPITFSSLPINLSVPIDAIIGLEFIFDHAIFIDFINREIYFSKATYLKPKSD